MNTRFSRLSAARWAAPLVTLLAAIVAGIGFGVQLVVLTLAAAALLLVIWLLWSSVQALAGQSELSFEEAFSLGARSVEEEQKRAVLRALKDLEYERGVGKISEQDFHEYSTRYREEAKRLIQTLDENLAEGRKTVEVELERRLAKLDVKTTATEGNGDVAGDGHVAVSADAAPDSAEGAQPAPADAEPSGRSSEAPRSSRETAPPITRECGECQAKNELDARFCKACGKPLVSIAEDNP